MASPVTITSSATADGVSPPINASWSTVRNSATGNTGELYLANYFNAGNYSISRKFMFFDLSVTNIPANATITAITFVHPQVANKTNDESMSIYLVPHTAADPPVSASFNDITLDSSPTWGTATIASLNTSGTTNITVNATGITAAQNALGGTWKVGIRGAKDVDNVTPTGINQYSFTTGASQIIVTYTVPSSSLETSYSFFM